jgi:antitoxin VapB
MGALNIKDSQVAEKARKLAKLQGKSITETLSDVLDVALKRAEHHAGLDSEARERRITEAAARYRASIPPDAPSYEQIMEDMYDEHGLPK